MKKMFNTVLMIVGIALALALPAHRRWQRPRDKQRVMAIPTIFR
jgi:hypothetical protein